MRKRVLTDEEYGRISALTHRLLDRAARGTVNFERVMDGLRLLLEGKKVVALVLFHTTAKENKLIYKPKTPSERRYARMLEDRILSLKRKLEEVTSYGYYESLIREEFDWFCKNRAEIAWLFSRQKLARGRPRKEEGGEIKRRPRKRR